MGLNEQKSTTRIGYTCDGSPTASNDEYDSAKRTVTKTFGRRRFRSSDVVCARAGN